MMGASAKLSEERGKKSTTFLLSGVLEIEVIICE
jgi:hypothetical protein